MQLNASYIHQLNNLIEFLYQKHRYSFINNNNVPSENL